MSLENCIPDPNDPLYRKTFEGISNPSSWNTDRLSTERQNRSLSRKQAKQLSQQKQKFKQFQNQCKNRSKAAKPSKSGTNKKKCICYVCLADNLVFDKVAGKQFFNIPFTTKKIPKFDHLVDKTVTYDSNRRTGEKCGACGGSKQLVDVNDDTSKYQQAAAKVDQKSPQIMEAESKMGLGGSRTTVVQGNETLVCGLNFNENITYEVLPDKAYAPSMKGGKIPQQSSVRVNAVVGKQGSIAWPQQMGNYTIKCANKLGLLAGAGGVNLATNGPLVFSSGIIKITAPQISIGCASGPMTLEGNSINITGKTIALTPTGGEVFVKGNVVNTGNITTQGHNHAESMSWTKAACVGTIQSTYTGIANPDVLQTRHALWGSDAVKGAVTDLKSFKAAIPVDSKTSSFRAQSPQETKNVNLRMKAISQLSKMYETEVTGWIIPGTRMIQRGCVPCNWGGIACGILNTVAVNFIEIHNKPHSHPIPEMEHKHEIRLPDIDYVAESAQQVRDKVLTPTHESGVPSDPIRDTSTRNSESQRTSRESSASDNLSRVSAEHSRIK